MATFIVTNNGNNAGSLKAALKAAESNPGADTITFSQGFSGESAIATDGTLFINGQVTIDGDLDNDGKSDVQIVGPGAAGMLDRTLFVLQSSANVIFDGITFAGGNATAAPGTYAAGALINQGKATILNSIFDGNVVFGQDAPVPLDIYGALSGGSGAGAIYNVGNLSISNTSFTSNRATGGSGASGGDAGPGPEVGDPGGDGGRGGDASEIINGVGGILTLTKVDFIGGSIVGASGGDGGNGASGSFKGGDGGNGGDASRMANLINYGKASGDFTEVSTGSNTGSPGTGGEGGPTGPGGTEGLYGIDGMTTVQAVAITIGTSGKNVAVGFGENDIMFGRGGDDVLNGGGDFDNLFGEADNDTLDGGAGDDFLSGGFGDDTFKLGLGDDFVSDEAGVDMLDFSAVKSGVDINLGIADAAQAYSGGSVTIVETLAGPTGIENVIGTAFADTFSGTSSANRLDGGAGKDTLNGLGGNDTYYVDNPGDIIVEAANNGTADIVRAAVSFTLAADDDIERLTTTSGSGTGAIKLTGNALKQDIVGNAGVNTLDDGGGGGKDTLTGLGGNDIYFIRGAGATIVEVSGGGTADTLRAAVSFNLAADDDIERMTTTSGTGTSAINLRGNAIVQEIIGNAGANIIDGKGGNDILTGLGGKDVFVFSTSLTGNADRITDFSVADDQIELNDAVFTALSTGPLAASAFKNLALGPKDATDRIIYSEASGRLYYDADGSGTAFDNVFFAVLDNKATLTAADFSVF